MQPRGQLPQLPCLLLDWLHLAHGVARPPADRQAPRQRRQVGQLSAQQRCAQGCLDLGIQRRDAVDFLILGDVSPGAGRLANGATGLDTDGLLDAFPGRT